MRRRRPKLRIVPDRPAIGRRKVPTALEVMAPGVVAGVAVAAALRFYLRHRNISKDAGVLTAEVHSNGHAKVKLNSLDQFSD